MTSSSPLPTRNRPTRRSLALATAAAVVVLAVAVPALIRDSSPEALAGPPLELSLGEGPGMAMCIEFDVAILAQAEVAFEGTVSSVDGETVALDVDRWYRGGDAATVSLTAPGGLVALIGGIDFVAGNQYLITATDGVVGYCGYSGQSTPELRSAFDSAFTN